MPATNFPEDNGSGSVINGLSKPQKTAVIILAALAVLIVIFWIWQMRARINQPFSYGGQTASSSATSTDINYILQNRDTDGDGLSDYDEIYTYKTSPYLEDSDSDGISDKKEVDQGTDPNCPQGKDCNASAETTASSTSSSDLSSPSSTTGVTGNLDSTTADQTVLQNALNGQIDAATLRQLLITSGASKTDLDQISDEDLMKSYQETLKAQSQSTTTTSK